MDKRAESLAQADQEEIAFDRARRMNLGSTAVMCRWRDHAETTLDKDNEITKHYQAQLDMLREQYELIWDKDAKAIANAAPLALEINKKYGKNQKDISQDDHVRLYKPNGPR